MPKYVSILRLREGILGLLDWRSRVDSQGAMHLVHFLAAKRKGVNAIDFTRYSEDDDRAFCDDALKVRPGSNPYFDPLDNEFRISSHFHSNVATMRKKTFADKWVAAEYRTRNGFEEWKFSKNYITILKDKMLSKSGVVTRVPVYDICAWLYRTSRFPNDVTMASLLADFRRDYHLDDTEYNTIFQEHELNGSADNGEGYFVDVPPTESLILELVTDVKGFDMAEAIASAGEREQRSPVRDTDVCDVLTRGRGQVILQGPPGTGKTFTAKRVASLILNASDEADSEALHLDPAKDWSDVDRDRIRDRGAWTIIQFHPSYTYEDFVRGIATRLENNTPTFSVQDRAFVRICKLAEKTQKPIVLIIDEINRGDLSKVLGELTYALEYRGQPVFLQYADSKGSSELRIPRNLYIIGTMNTADHSIAHIDYAIRRRFDFIELMPDRSVIMKAHEGDATLRDNVIVLFDAVNALLKDAPDQTIGHSFFLGKTPQELANSFVFQVLPLLADYRREGIIGDADSMGVKGWPGGSMPLKHERPFELVEQVVAWLREKHE